MDVIKLDTDINEVDENATPYYVCAYQQCMPIGCVYQIGGGCQLGWDNLKKEVTKKDRCYKTGHRYNVCAYQQYMPIYCLIVIGGKC